MFSIDYTPYARAAERWPAHPAIWFGRFNFLALSGNPAQAVALAEQSRSRPLGVPEDSFRLGIRLANALDEHSPSTSSESIKAIREGVATGAQSTESAVLYLSALGGIDAAFDLLDGYYLGLRDGSTGRRRRIARLDRRYTDFLFMPSTEPLRRDPRFSALTAVAGLDGYWQAARTRPDYRVQSNGSTKITSL